MGQYLVCLAVPIAVFVAGFVVAHYRRPRPALALMAGGIAGVVYAAYRLHGFRLAADAQAGIGLVFIAIEASAIAVGLATCGVVFAMVFSKACGQVRGEVEEVKTKGIRSEGR
jgi:hypothetical protein